MLKVKVKTILIVVVSFLLFACWGFFIPKEEDIDFVATHKIFPDLGTIGTEFFFKIETLSIKNDTIKKLDRYKFRWDFDNDEKFDTEWLDTSSINYVFNTTGMHRVAVEVKTPGLDIFSDTCIVFVQPLIKITDSITGNVQGSADWALDGSNRVAYDSPSDSILTNQTCENVIWTVEHPGGKPKQVSMNCAYFPEWSPDGEHILFRRNQEIWIVDLITNEEMALLTQSGIIPFVPSWSHKNFKLAFTTLNSIGIYRLNTGGVSTIPTTITYNLISWSPDDRLVATATRNNELSVIDIIDIEDEKAAMSYPLGFHYSGGKLDWSLDGKWLSIGFADKSSTIYIIDLDSGNFKQINIAGLEYTWYASWSYDGSMLVFEGQAPSETTSIWAIEIPDDF
jgi:tricorn protease-like protein